MTEKIIIEDYKNTIHRLQNECTEKIDLIMKTKAQYNAVLEQNKSLQTELKQKEQECEELKEKLKPFEDEYFKNLDTKTIAELAKKSFRLTRENRKLEDVLDEIEDICCAKTKNCHLGCFICSTKCNENKILNIINKADFRTDAAPVSEDIELTKPKGLSSETIRAQRKSKTAKEVQDENT